MMLLLRPFKVGAVGTGGGHGAPGGSVSGNNGGNVYDTTKLPYQQGSGGGSGGTNGTGGAGGGYLQIRIYDVLTVEGKKKDVSFLSLLFYSTVAGVVPCGGRTKKSKRKVQGVPQSHTAALPRPKVSPYNIIVQVIFYFLWDH